MKVQDNTDGRDLEEAGAKHPKTATNPKGAGRPKGSTTPFYSKWSVKPRSTNPTKTKDDGRPETGAEPKPAQDHPNCGNGLR